MQIRRQVVVFDAPDLEAIENGLASPHIDIRNGEFDPPNNVGQAGQGGVSVGAITADRNHPSATGHRLLARFMLEKLVADHVLDADALNHPGLSAANGR